MMLHYEKYLKPMSKRLSMAAVCAAIIMAKAAHADDGNNIFSINGFGTVGAVHSSSTDGDYVGTFYQRSGAGASHSWAYGVDSKLGVQLDGKFTDQLLAVVQVVAEEQTDHTFSPRLEWVYLQYAITPDLKVRAGRIVMPTYLKSDARKVGYSNPWVRPPLETYNLNPITNSNGIDASYKLSIGNAVNTVHVNYGRTSVDAVLPTGQVVNDIKATQFRSISDTVEYGALTVRIGLTRANFSVLGLTPPMQIVNAGVIYDPGNWFIQGEFTMYQLPPLVTNEKAFYVTAGYRLNNFTPYATYSQVKPNDAIALLSFDQKTSSIGVRWDAMTNTDIKLQLDKVSLGKGNVGFFSNIQPSLAGKTVNIISLAVDFVF